MIYMYVYVLKTKNATRNYRHTMKYMHILTSYFDRVAGAGRHEDVLVVALDAAVSLLDVRRDVATNHLYARAVAVRSCGRHTV